MGPKPRVIEIDEIYTKLGPQRAAALPGMHAISGADVTGSFSGKTKTAFWKRFMDANDRILQALSSLGRTFSLTDDIYNGLEEYICSVYLKEPKISKLSELRWWLFSKKQFEGAALPPTLASFRPAVRRAHLQAMIWNTSNVPRPSLPSPTECGWRLEELHFVPEISELPCAPPELISSIRCACRQSRCTGSCKCVKNGLPCTEMCSCSGNEETCDNHPSEDCEESSKFDELFDESDSE